MSTPVGLDDGDRISGYRVLRSAESSAGADGFRGGRVVLIDRGPQYAMRYVVAFHPAHARGWVDGVLHDDYDDASDTFVVRANHYTAHRGCRCHAS
jgi:hypothetical protein